MPTAEDMKAEKTHQGMIEGAYYLVIYFHEKNFNIGIRNLKFMNFKIFTGVESFTPDKLKPAKTREPASGVEGNYIYII